MKRQNTSGLPPLTPDFSGTKCGTTFHPATVPDTHAEEILFQLYLREKTRAERYLKERNAARDDLASRKKWGRIKRLVSLTPTHSEKAGR